MWRPSVVLSILLSLAVCSMGWSALAQSGDSMHSKGRGHGGMLSREAQMFLRGLDLGFLGPLQGEAVRRDLKLTESQTEKVRTLFAGIGTIATRCVAELKDLDSQERAIKVAKARKEVVLKLDAAQSEVPRILESGQMERLKQIYVRQEGAFALRNPEIRKAIGLNEEQNGKIQKIVDQTAAEALKLMQSLRGLPREEMNAKRAEVQKRARQLHADASKQILETITPEQREKLENMKGKPLEGNRKQKPAK